MKKFDLSLFSISILVLAAVLLGVGGNSYVRATADKAAEVNGTEITKDQLYQYMVDHYGEKSIDHMIKDILIEQEAAKTGISVTPKELDKSFDNYLAHLEQKTKQKIDDYLKENGTTREELKAKYQQKMLLTKLADKEVPVTDEEMKKLYDKRKDIFAKHGETFDQAKDEVKQTVMQNKLKKWLNTLKKNAKILITDPSLSAKVSHDES